MKSRLVFSILLAAVNAVMPCTNSFAAPADNFSPYIIGGKPVSEGKYPWMGALLFKYNGKAVDEQICGVTLVAPQYAVTAAHCVAYLGFFSNEVFIEDPDNLELLFGQNQLSSGKGVRVGVLGIAVHPKLDLWTLNSDFALLKLDTPLPFETISLASANDPDLYKAGTEAKAIGWGRTSSKYSVLPDTLQEAVLPLVDDQICLNTNGRYIDPTTMVCAGTLPDANSTAPMTTVCNGDSGGPLVVQVGDKYKQVGITSWGFDCASTTTFPVFSKVSSGVEFLNSRPVFAPRPNTLLKPVISGKPSVGSVLTVSTGAWKGDPVEGYQYQWYKFDYNLGSMVAINGATRQTFTVTEDLAAGEVFAEVAAVNNGGSSYATSDSVFIENYVLPPIPTPTPEPDTISPKVIKSGRSCTKSSCTQFVQVDDGLNTSGISIVTGSLKVTVPAKVVNGKTVKAKVVVSTLQASQFSQSGWRFKMARIKGAKYQLVVKATDGAGNTSKQLLIRISKM